MPYITSFLPADNLLEDPMFQTDQDQVPLNENPTPLEISQAEEELESIAENVHWELDYNMFDKFDSWGMNFITEQDRPYQKETPAMIAESDRDLDRRGISIRPINIVIARQYYDTIKGSDKDSEKYLRAVWHAAITMAHEIGHTLLIHDIRWVSDDCSEPYVGDDCLSELGHSFLGWIFSGFTPGTIERGRDAPLFERPLCWKRQKKTTDLQRQPYLTSYSISTRYLQSLLSRAFWKNYSGAKIIDGAAKAAIRPTIPEGDSKPAILSGVAISTVPDFVEVGNELEPKLVWKAPEYRDRSPRSTDNNEPLLSVLQRLKEIKDELELLREDQIKNKVGIPGEDDIETFPGLPLVPGKIEIEDGKEDKHVKIEVAYTPAPWLRSTSSKRKRSFSDDDEEDEDEQDYKRLKKGKKPKIPDDLNHPNFDLQDALLDLSIPFIESGYTRRQANDFLLSKGERGFAKVQESLAWQHGHLDRSHGDDLGVIARIRVWFLDQLLDIYQDDTGAQIKIQEVYNATIEDWDIPELLRYCQECGLNYDEYGDTYETLRKRIEPHMAAEVSSMRAVLKADRTKANDEAKKKARNTTSKVKFIDDHESADDKEDSDDDNPIVRDWNDVRLKNFLIENDLPDWGNIMVLRERYYADKYEQRNGYPRPRNTSAIRQSTLTNGTEVYGWSVNVHTRTVLDLKCAIYLMCVLPANSILHLEIAGIKDLPDDLLLSEIDEVMSGKDHRFILTISEYKPKIKLVAPPPQEPPKVIWDSKERMYNAMKILKAKARNNFYENDEPPPVPVRTIGERMAELAQHKQALDRIFLDEGSTNQASLVPLNGRTKSALQLMDAVEVYEENCARMGVRQPEDVQPVFEIAAEDDGDGLGKGFGIGNSHMADLYRGVEYLIRPDSEKKRLLGIGEFASVQPYGGQVLGTGGDAPASAFQIQGTPAEMALIAAQVRRQLGIVKMAEDLAKAAKPEVKEEDEDEDEVQEGVPEENKENGHVIEEVE